MAWQHNDYAVVVGINHYEYFDPLEGPENDREGFLAWLTAEAGGGVPAENVLPPGNVFPGEAGALAAKAGPRRHHIEDCFEYLRARQRKEGWKGRRLYIFLAGHGIAGPSGVMDTRFLTVRSHKTLTEDIDAVWEASTFLVEGTFRQVVLLLDCCRTPLAWAVGKRDMQSPSLEVLNRLANAHPRDQAPVSWYFAFATSFGSKAREHPWKERGNKIYGVFTRVLLEGLEGFAANAYNRLYTNHLTEHLNKGVPALRPDQKPAVFAQPDFVLLEKTSPEAGLVPVYVRAPDSKRVRVFDGTDIQRPLDVILRPVGANRIVEIKLAPYHLYLFGLDPVREDLRGTYPYHLKPPGNSEADPIDVNDPSELGA